MVISAVVAIFVQSESEDQTARIGTCIYRGEGRCRLRIRIGPDYCGEQAAETDLVAMQCWSCTCSINKWAHRKVVTNLGAAAGHDVDNALRQARLVERLCGSRHARDEDNDRVMFSRTVMPAAAVLPSTDKPSTGCSTQSRTVPGSSGWLTPRPASACGAASGADVQPAAHDSVMYVRHDSSRADAQHHSTMIRHRACGGSARLNNDCVAGHERRTDLGHRQVNRVVERRDAQHHTQRHLSVSTLALR